MIVLSLGVGLLQPRMSCFFSGAEVVTLPFLRGLVVFAERVMEAVFDSFLSNGWFFPCVGK